MAGKPSLQVVKTSSRPTRGKQRQPTVLEAAESGDYLAELLALRRRIASAVTDVNTPARDLAALTRRQLEISKEIKALQSRDAGDEIGDAASTPDEEWAVT